MVSPPRNARLIALVLAFAAVVVTALALAPSARADFFSSNPGPLTQSHAKIDDKDKCQECHVGSRELSADKCLACHKPIAKRQAERRGVHATPKALGKACEMCHTDHKGRGKDILGWSTFGGKDRFDHAALTSWPLEGKHQTTACEKCHTQKTSSGTITYLKNTPACVSCHDNPHGDLREPMRRCERCHDARTWKMLEKSQFDHDRDTRYQLEKKHEEVTCVACHARRASGEPPKASAAAPAPDKRGYQRLTFRYPTWGTDCMPCHDNVHGSSLFGQKACKLCHSAKVEFTKINFDHNRRTRFPLEGAHEKKATCASCHKKEKRGSRRSRARPTAGTASSARDRSAGRSTS